MIWKGYNYDFLNINFTQQILNAGFTFSLAFGPNKYYFILGGGGGRGMGKQIDQIALSKQLKLSITIWKGV